MIIKAISVRPTQALSIFVLLSTVLPILNTNANPTGYQDVALMAHIIGSGAMNLDHYFHTLEVACENRSPGLWRIIDQDKRRCVISRSARNGFYETLPKGSFYRKCNQWRINEGCYNKLARDLDQCLAGDRGTKAETFMKAYVSFTCRDIPDTEAQLGVHTTTRPPFLEQGVFKCFPELQDRIVNCVKDDKYSGTQCSQFVTVQRCYAQYYSDYKDCGDIGVISYLRDLFRHMNYALHCAEQNVWDITVQSLKNRRTFLPSDSTFPSVLSRQRAHDVSHYTLLSQNFPPSSAEGPRYFPTTPSSHRAIQRPPGSQSLLPTPLPPLSSTLQNRDNGDRLWKPIPLLVPLEFYTEPVIPAPPTFVDPATGTVLHEGTLQAFKNVFNDSQINDHSPTVALSYQRYGTLDHRDVDRFYSFRKESGENYDKDFYIRTTNEEHRGAEPQRYRGLSRRPDGHGRNLKPTPIILIDMGDARFEWDYKPDNHLRKYKDDHQFHIQTTPRLPHGLSYIQVPFSGTSKRTADVREVERTMIRHKQQPVQEEDSIFQLQVPVNQTDRTLFSTSTPDEGASEFRTGSQNPLHLWRFPPPPKRELPALSTTAAPVTVVPSPPTNPISSLTKSRYPGHTKLNQNKTGGIRHIVLKHSPNDRPRLHYLDNILTTISPTDIEEEYGHNADLPEAPSTVKPKRLRIKPRQRPPYSGKVPWKATRNQKNFTEGTPGTLVFVQETTTNRRIFKPTDQPSLDRSPPLVLIENQNFPNEGEENARPKLRKIRVKKLRNRTSTEVSVPLTSEH